MEGREQTAEADEVVSVLDIVRIPVVFSMGAEEPVLKANFLVLLCTRGQLVGVIHLLPVQRCAGGLIVSLGRHSSVLSSSSCSSPTDGSGDQFLNLGLAFPRVESTKSEGGVQERKNSKSRPRSFFLAGLAQSQSEWGRPSRAPRDDATSTAVRRFELKPRLCR